ncbi:MAG: hypothetical protein AABZ31_10590 [Bdellovibrionota bacterium]
MIRARMLTVFLSFLFLLPTVGFAKTQKDEAPPPYQDTPVERFGEIEAGLYRSAQPEDGLQLAALKEMGIKTILSFQTDKKKIAAEAAIAKSLGLKFISRPLDGFWRPKPEEANEVQGYMNDHSLRPLLIHCSHGRERTGLMGGLYRYYTNKWTPQEAYKEMKAYGFRSIVFSMKDYLEDATDTDL